MRGYLLFSGVGNPKSAAIPDFFVALVHFFIFRGPFQTLMHTSILSILRQAARPKNREPEYGKVDGLILRLTAKVLYWVSNFEGLEC
jgi:hypothetical protein